MARFRLFLIEGPIADKQTLEKTAWMLPLCLKRSALLGATRGEDFKEWLLIASTDSRRDVKKIEKALKGVGCVLALEDEGRSAWQTIRGIASELANRDRSGRAAGRRDETPLWDQSAGFSGMAQGLWRRRRAVAALTALALVVGTSAVLTLYWLGRDSERAESGTGDDSPFSGPQLPSVSPPTLQGAGEGSGGTDEVAAGSRVGAGRRQPPQPSLRQGGSAAIPDIAEPVGKGRTSGQGKGKLERIFAGLDVLGNYWLKVAGFLLGLGCSGLFGLSLRRIPSARGTRSILLSRGAPMLVAALGASTLLVVRTDWHLGLGSKHPAPPPASSAEAHRGPARTVPPTPGGKPAVGSFREFVASLPSPATAPCAPGSKPFAELLCRLRKRHELPGGSGEGSDAGGEARARALDQVDAALDAVAAGSPPGTTPAARPTGTPKADEGSRSPPAGGPSGPAAKPRAKAVAERALATPTEENRSDALSAPVPDQSETMPMAASIQRTARVEAPPALSLSVPRGAAAAGGQKAGKPVRVPIAGRGENKAPTPPPASLEKNESSKGPSFGDATAPFLGGLAFGCLGFVLASVFSTGRPKRSSVGGKKP